jgi:hypothetical protein
MNTDNPYETKVPVSSALARLLTDAAQRLGLDPSSAAKAASQGAVLVDQVAVATFVLPGTNAHSRYDMLSVATLDDVQLTALSQARIVLNTNMLLGPLSGFTFAASQMGELQVFCGMKLADLDGESLARTLMQLGRIAGSMRKQLMQLGTPAAEPATPTPAEGARV